MNAESAVTGDSGWRKIVGPCYTTTGVAQTLGWDEEEVRRASEDLRLLCVSTSDGVLLYPAFQVHDGHVVDGLQEVLRILRTGTAGRWTWAQFLNVAMPGEKSHIQGLREGRLQDVLRDARQEAAGWNG